ncbi:MAG: universal stress protein [Thermoplasmata archaeon]
MAESPPPNPPVGHPSPAPGAPVFRRCLVALDLTESDAPVLRILPGLRNAIGAELVVVHVVLVGTSVSADAMDGAPGTPGEQAMLAAMRSRVEGALGGSAAPTEFKILHGDPSERLVEFADHSDCDLLVLSSHRRGLLGRLVRGSVSSSVVSSSHRSVLVVGDP